MGAHLKEYATRLENLANQPGLTSLISKLILSSFRGATKVVAANDSLDNSKQVADYVCDGIDDQVQIQAAIDALPAVGGTLILLEGVFTKGNAIGIAIPSNTEIKMSSGTTVKFADGIDADAEIFVNSDPGSGNRNIVIRDGVLDGNRDNQNSGIQCAIKFTKVHQSVVDCNFQNLRTQTIWEIIPGDGNTFTDRRIGFRTEIYPFEKRPLGELKDYPPIFGREIDVTTDDESWFPVITVTPDGTLYIIYRGGTNHAAALNDPIKLIKSVDMGATWTAVGTIYQDPGYAQRRFTILYIPAEDCLLAILARAQPAPALDFENFTMKSYDGGVTWSTPVFIPTNFTEFEDVNGPPIIKANGVLLLPIEGRDIGDSKVSAGVYTSEDCGDSWTFQKVADGVADNTNYDEPCLVETQDGDIYMFSRSYKYYKSPDGGSSWIGPVTYYTYLPFSGRPCAIAPKNYDKIIYGARLNKQLGIRSMPIPPESDLVNTIHKSPIAFRQTDPTAIGTGGAYFWLAEIFPGCMACVYHVSSIGSNIKFCYILYRSVISPLGDPNILYNPLQSYANLFDDGEFKKGKGSWTTSNSTVSEEHSIVKIGDTSLKITGDGVGDWPNATRIINISTDHPELLGRAITLGFWAYAPLGNIRLTTVGLDLPSDPIEVHSALIPSDGKWHWYTITKYLRDNTSEVKIRLQILRHATTEFFYVDGLILVEGTTCPAYTPRLASEQTKIGVSDLFMDVLAVSATHVVNAQACHADPTTLSVGAGIAAQPDVPRTLSWVVNNAGGITAADITITGIDAKGYTTTESFDLTGGLTGETNNAFATVSEVKIENQVNAAAGDTITIGITDVLGFSNPISETGDVYKIKKNNADAIVAAAQANIAYDTYDLSVIGLAVTDDFTIWYKTNLNIVT